MTTAHNIDLPAVLAERLLRRVWAKCGHGRRKHTHVRRENGLYQSIFRKITRAPCQD